MNVNEFLDQYYHELLQLNPNLDNVVAATAESPDCNDCGKSPFDKLADKLRAVEGLFGPSVVDALSREVAACSNEWAREKASAQQYAVEMSLWLDFFQYMNARGGPSAMFEYIMEEYWTCVHPSWEGLIKNDSKCPLCHKPKPS